MYVMDNSMDNNCWRAVVPGEFMASVHFLLRNKTIYSKILIEYNNTQNKRNQRTGIVANGV